MIVIYLLTGIYVGYDIARFLDSHKPRTNRKFMPIDEPQSTIQELPDGTDYRSPFYNIDECFI